MSALSGRCAGTSGPAEARTPRADGQAAEGVSEGLCEEAVEAFV